MSPTPPTEGAGTRATPPFPGAVPVTAGLLALALAALAALVIVHPWTRPIPPLTVEVTVSGDGHHLTREPALRAPHGGPPSGTEVIRVDGAVRRQQIEGFGSAMTDSSAYLLAKTLSKPARTTVMHALFSAAGIHISNLRIPIGASDFTATGVPYTYDDMPAGESDPRLANFRISHDNAYVLPLLRAAQAEDHSLGFIATAWSAPNWMKANDKLSNEANAGVLKPTDYRAYAEYLVVFLFHYEEAGIEVGEITPANEPTTATRYPGMNISPAQMNTLISRYIVPILRQRGLATEVYGADLGWGTAAYARSLVTGAAGRDLAGIAWHCYYGSPTAMSAVHALDPKLGVQLTECSPGIATEPLSEIVIESLRNGASVVDLWNLALDDRGGPVQPPNHGCPGCYGLVRIDTATGTASYTDAFYDLGQASRYIAPGAVRLKSNTFVRYDYTGPGKPYVSANVDDVAIRDPDGTIVLMADNTAPRRERISVRWKGYAFSYTLAAGETATFRWR